ncbi:MAG: FAD-binding domain-containing protein [Janthinobacterium lividum]
MPSMERSFTLTRAAALDHLAAIVPRTGHAYAAHRNTDRGPDLEPTTTALSPYLRRRLILEQEVIAASLAVHGPGTAAKFVDEVFWRSYFKGYLETHPKIWPDYLDLAAHDHNNLATSSGQRRVFEDAVSGRTGIECFDDWAIELVETGWLHNHTRMWFASIWIFTLRLPWALGAEFFLRHLIDGDPASNTLSWRWVAGLHTRGKNYAARADNIHRFTDGRYSPTGLDEDPAALEESHPAPVRPIPAADAAPAGDVALLLHLDDLNPETLPLGRARVTRVGGMLAHAPAAVELVRRADEAAMADALSRAAEHFGCPAGPVTKGWADGLPIVTAWAPVGPSADALPTGCTRVRREWDERVWPKSTRGYFQVKTIIPEILRECSTGLAAIGEEEFVTERR